jgi:DUF4097 and DUF4098 domain-containing protein YvlB
MNTLGRFSILLFLLSVSRLTLAADRKTYPMDIPAAGVKTITFDVQEGEFVVHGSPDAKTVSMRVSIDRTWIFRLGEEDILKRLIKMSGEGTEHLTIVTDIPRSISNWGRAQYPIDFEVIVPDTATLQVRDTSGIIRISDMKAPVDIHDGSGTLSVNGVRADLTIAKDSGDIVVEHVSGTTKISSQSGQMKLRDLADVDIERSDGNLDMADIGATHVRNNSGNLKITSVAGPLDIDDESGEIYVADVKGDVKIRDTSGQIRVLRAGAVTINDTDGDITVQRAPSVAVLQKDSGAVKVSEISGDVQVPPKIELKRSVSR